MRALHDRGHDVDVHDPIADPGEARALYDIDLLADLDAAGGYACIIGAVAHDTYCDFTPKTFAGLLAPTGLVADIKGMWRDLALPPEMRRWQL